LVLFLTRHPYPLSIFFFKKVKISIGFGIGFGFGFGFFKFMRQGSQEQAASNEPSLAVHIYILSK
jgi:hypothetical protein